MTVAEMLLEAAVTRAKVGETLLGVGASLVSGVANQQEAESCELEVKLAGMWLQCAANLESEAKAQLIEQSVEKLKKGGAA